MLTQKNQSGLTLIETIVLMLIVLLAAGTYTLRRVDHQQLLERDAIRKENIRVVSLKLEEFKKDNKSYPASLQDLVSEGMIDAIPLDPSSHKTYTYLPAPSGCSTELANCKTYTLTTRLENKLDKAGDPATHFLIVSGD